MEIKYIYTNHLLERMTERFGFEWNNMSRTEVYKEIDKIMDETKEDRSYLNDTKFMINLQDLHGFDSKYEFRSHIDMNILFVMIIEKGRRIVKTCYPLTTSRFIHRKKFQKQDKNKSYTPRSKRNRQPVREWEAMRDHFEQNEGDES